MYVDQNKFLCHADTIHWNDIIKNPRSELLVVPSNNSGNSCEYFIEQIWPILIILFVFIYLINYLF